MNWEVPANLWKNGDVWIIGGGASITKQFNIPNDIVDKVGRGELPLSSYSPYMKSIHGKHVIGINVAYMLGNWVDMTFFGDNNYFLNHKDDMYYNFPGLKVGCANACQRYPWAKFLCRDNRKPFGITNIRKAIAWNGNSGAAAISVAANAGAKRIFLLGFDMCLDDTNATHFHNEYRKGQDRNIPKDEKKLPYQRHIRGFPTILADAMQRGIEIINVSPTSAITEFKKVSLSEALTL